MNDWVTGREKRIVAVVVAYTCSISQTLVHVDPDEQTQSKPVYGELASIEGIEERFAVTPPANGTPETAAKVTPVSNRQLLEANSKTGSLDALVCTENLPLNATELEKKAGPRKETRDEEEVVTFPFKSRLLLSVSGPEKSEAP